MEKLTISPTSTTPEIKFSPGENIFYIRGLSAPEDVRALYYPVIEWITKFIDEIISDGKEKSVYTLSSPLRFRIDLEYFNSSTAKFLYDIFMELQRFGNSGIPFTIEWIYDEDDPDLKEAGLDIASLAGMEFTYIPK
jgi:hypothetical protein